MDYRIVLDRRWRDHEGQTVATDRAVLSFAEDMFSDYRSPVAWAIERLCDHGYHLTDASDGRMVTTFGANAADGTVCESTANLDGDWTNEQWAAVLLAVGHNGAEEPR